MTTNEEVLLCYFKKTYFSLVVLRKYRGPHLEKIDSRELQVLICSSRFGAIFRHDCPFAVKTKTPDAVEEVAVIVSIDKEVISYAVVQHSVAVLEVVEDTQDGTVIIVRGQWSQADVLQSDVLTLVCGHKGFDVQLQIQHLFESRKREENQ